MQVLKTDRLRLRWLEPGDAEFILQLLNQPSFLEHIGDRGVRNLQDARDYISSGPGASYAEHGHGLNLVELKADQTPVGICGILKRPTLEDPDIGYALLESHWGQGYALEAAQATLAHGRAELGLERIVAITSTENATSKKLLEKLGMVFEGMVSLTEGEPEARLYA